MNEDPLIHTLADLVRLNSVNPAFEGGQPEAGIIGYIRSFFEQRGLETSEQEVLPGRPNLIVRLPGRNPRRRLVLEAHVDTVSVKGMTIPPFEPALADGRLYGRGACDNKGGLAAMMHALAWCRQEGLTPPCEVWLAAVVDEEAGFRGVAKLCEGLSAEAAVVAEPTQLRVVIASKGVVRLRIHTLGRSAHSSQPHLGVNAITMMARLIVALEEDVSRLAAQPHPLLGPATASIGLIRGGVQVNTVPDECSIDIDRRLLPGEAAEEIVADYRRIVAAVKSVTPGFEAMVEPPSLIEEPLDTPFHSLPARLAAQILGELKLDPTPASVPFCSDAGKLDRHGVPSILFGPGSIDQAHAAVEYVDCAQVRLAFDFYRRFIERFE